MAGASAANCEAHIIVQYGSASDPITRLAWQPGALTPVHRRYHTLNIQDQQQGDIDLFTAHHAIGEQSLIRHRQDGHEVDLRNFPQRIDQQRNILPFAARASTTSPSRVVRRTPSSNIPRSTTITAWPSNMT